MADAWKQRARGIPQGTFLLAYYENEDNVSEALLLRVLQPTNLPTDNDVISSMIEYYKDNLKTSGNNNQLDTFTRYEFSFSGVECRILGTFYKDATGRLQFGADVENFYSAHNYSVIKPNPQVLTLIANFREDAITGRPTDIQIGKVRYSSSRRFQDIYETEHGAAVPVFVRPQDFLGKRTALFGMTRTGKSNTVKKIIQATVAMSDKAPFKLDEKVDGKAPDYIEPFTDEGVPKFPVGQIIFDINGEYANANMQDEGTAVFEIYKDKVTRYSVLPKPEFRVMKVNFYADVSHGFDFIKSFLAADDGDYVRSFLSIDLSEPEDKNDFSAKTRYERKKAAYLCCLYKADFPASPNLKKLYFHGEQKLNSLVRPDEQIDPKNGISFDAAVEWFTKIWENYDSWDYFKEYRKDHDGREWADEDLKALMAFLTRRRQPGKGATNINGYTKLRPMIHLHTNTVGKSFREEISDELRRGRIVIIDLSQGDEDTQRLYSVDICSHIFQGSMSRFIDNRPSNFIQFYFEEAHNLFPKKDDKDLSQVYNRIAKEGAKLSLGMLYLTQEVSSISSNILKNTQNWFIAHLNNDDEIKEIKKYYDFGDFSDSLVRFSASSDKGFVRMKTYSNPFVVPVQVDRFSAAQG